MVHAKGLASPRSATIFVFNAAGQIFLQKRSMKKDVSPGLWTVSCSGHVDAGEDYDTAARRELGEELGLKRTDPPTLWFRVEACVETDWEFSWMYRTTARGPLHASSAGNRNRASGSIREELGRWLMQRPQDFLSRVPVDLVGWQRKSRAGVFDPPAFRSGRWQGLV